MKIIFVCHGSICRSPAAEFIFKKIIKEKGLEDKVDVKSRALSSEEEFNDIYPPMKECLKRHDIPFSKHYSEVLTLKEVNDTDFIFYMDEENKFIIDRKFSQYINKFHLITMFSDTLNTIEDPWYSGNFDKVVEELIECVNQIIEELIINECCFCLAT